jgi:Cdc6-like AAA superfamily ATPase
MLNRDAFVKSYNHFDGRPLIGQTLRDFYIDDFCKLSVKEIVTTVEISEQFRKMLLIGHRGCGKSTILNKVAEELRNKYYVVSFSASDELNMMDVETVDILLAAYLQLLKSLDKNWLIKFLEKDSTIKDFIDILKKPLKLDASVKDIELFNTIAFKFKVENESRAEMRSGLYGQVKELLESIDKVCQEIEKQKQKTILIIIDDLDKLQTTFSEKIFFENQFLLTLPKVKVIYTFPLDTYYSAAFKNVSNLYKDQFIPLVNLRNRQGQEISTNISSLCKLINKRINHNLIKPEALNHFIDSSGGLLRDLVQFMQDACNLAIVEEKDVIDFEIARQVVGKFVNGYYQRFDVEKYKDAIEKISNTKEKDGNEKLVYFLRYLFALEYQLNGELWYDVHPCLKMALDRDSI